MSHNALKGASLKGASVIQQSTLSFPPTEISLLSKSLELSKFYIERNKDQFQDSQDMIQKINSAINIISSKTNNKNNQQSQQSVKGSSDITRNNDGYRNLVNIRQRFGLVNKGNKSVTINQLKGASQNNNNICNKKKSLINIREHFNLV
jgi:hypothetical protein